MNVSDVPRKDSVVSLKDTYLELQCDSKQENIVNFEEKTDLRFVKFVPNALFSEYRLIFGTGKHSEKVSYAHIFV